MLLVENLLVMKKIFPDVMVQGLKKIDSELGSSNFTVLPAKNGMPTLALQDETGNLNYLHSSYDPCKEAESFIERMDEAQVKDTEHVFFYGMGLGYHIEAFNRKYPDKYFTIYEPSPQAFCHFLSTRQLAKFPTKKLHTLFIEFSEGDRERNLNLFFWNKLGLEKLIFVTLPSYERVFKDIFDPFSKIFVEKMKDASSNKVTQAYFQKRWTVNSMLNFKENLVNDSIFDCNPDYFRGKPAILAAAGPSLSFEMESLRKIRDENLAYIFSVGSAIKALLSKEIHPHAAVTMDPGMANLLVFEDVINQGIDDIPLIYGTSVGYETLVRYTGPKLYMTMDRDLTTPYYFNSDKSDILDIVGDAPTIAITTLQLMIKLGFDPIIFAGQNLALYDNSRYAEGVKYSYRAENHKATTAELNNTVETEDVFGNKIQTFQSFVFSRKIMEAHISSCKTASKGERAFINTTRFGAKIDGAPYKTFEELFETDLQKPVVQQNWYIPAVKNKPLKKNLEMLDEKMNNELERLWEIIDAAEQQLAHVKKISKYGSSRTINDELIRFDNIFNKILNNSFYKCHVASMLMVELSIINNRTQKMRTERQFSVRAEKTVYEFSRFFEEMKHDINKYSKPIYAQIREAIANYSDEAASETDREATEC